MTRKLFNKIGYQAYYQLLVLKSMWKNTVNGFCLRVLNYFPNTLCLANDSGEKLESTSLLLPFNSPFSPAES